MNLYADNMRAHKSLLCRICATNSKDPLISIYCGGSNNFALKIMFYLPVKVTPNDGLPIKICTTCLDNILKWDDFYQSCVDADKRLKSIFFQNNLLSENSSNIKKEKIMRGDPTEEYATKCDNVIADQEDVGGNANTLLSADEQIESLHPRRRIRRNCNLGNAVADNIVIKEELDIREDVIIGEEITFDEAGEISSPSLELMSMTEDDIRATYPNYICPDCGLSFLNKEKLAIHSLEVHHKHQVLQSLLRQQLNSVDEMHILEGAKVGTNYLCKECNRAFASPSKLKVHARTHTGEKPFKCLLCDKTFRQTCHTVTHMKLTHFNIRRYECEVCHKHFKVRSNYRFHMRTHKGENAFDLCFDDLC